MALVPTAKQYHNTIVALGIVDAKAVTCETARQLNVTDLDKLEEQIRLHPGRVSLQRKKDFLCNNRVYLEQRGVALEAEHDRLVAEKERLAGVIQHEGHSAAATAAILGAVASDAEATLAGDVPPPDDAPLPDEPAAPVFKRFRRTAAKPKKETNP